MFPQNNLRPTESHTPQTGASWGAGQHGGWYSEASRTSRCHNPSKRVNHMFERFLIPLDTTEVAEQILAWAAPLAQRLDQPVVLLSVVPDQGELGPAAQRHGPALSSLLAQRRTAAQGYLDTVQSRLVNMGIKVTTDLAVGPVAESIVAAAASHQSGLIAMATHGRSGPERWFLGSVADRVLRTAAVPVLLVRPVAGKPAITSDIRLLLLPLDGSELGEDALPAAIALGKALDVPVRLLRTVSLTWIASSGGPYGMESYATPEIIAALEEDARSYLEKAAERIRSAGVAVDTAFALREPASEITDLAAAAPGTLVVMHSHGRSGLQRSLLGSVTDAVVRSSTAPVLVIRNAP